MSKIQKATTDHARERVRERYMNRPLRQELSRAVQKGNFFAVKDESNSNNVIAYFSSDKFFLWKVVLGQNGCVVTVLPVRKSDLSLCIKKGILNPILWKEKK